MGFDDGILTLCELVNTAAPGAMPKEQLRPVAQSFYRERTVGYNRQYAAMGVNEHVDALFRIWREPFARIGMYAVVEGGEQYRVTNVQHMLDEDGLKVTDLTLERMDDHYDVAEQA